MVVEPDITVQGGLQVLRTVEAVRSQDLRNPTIEAFYHPIGLGRAGLGQTMFDTQRSTESIKLVFARRLAILGAKQPVRELLAVVASA